MTFIFKMVKLTVIPSNNWEC